MSAVFAGQQLKITWTCKDGDGNAIDLSGETVKIKIRNPAGTESTEDGVDKDFANGQVSYTWAVDTLTEGEWRAKPYILSSQVPGTVYRFRVSSMWER